MGPAYACTVRMLINMGILFTINRCARMVLNSQIGHRMLTYKYSSCIADTRQEFVVVPATAFTETVSKAELWRQSFQANMSRGSVL